MNVWIGKGTEIEGKFTKFCKAEGIQIYTVVRKVKFAFVKRTIRSSNKNLSRYVEDYGYKFLHKLTQFVTTLNFGGNCCIDLIPKNVMNSDF